MADGGPLALTEPVRGEHLLVAEATAVLWPGPGWPRTEAGWAHAFATVELTAAPGLTELGHDSQDDAAAALRLLAEDMLAALSSSTRSGSLEIRYVTEPRQDAPTRLRLFLTARAQATTPDVATSAAAQALTAAVGAVPPSYQWTEVDPREANPPAGCGEAIVEVRKQESVTPPQVPNPEAAYYYVPYPIRGDGSAWPRLPSALARAEEPVVLSVVFVPTLLQPDEQAAIAQVHTGLAFYGTPRTEHDANGNPYNVPADSNAAEALAVWEQMLHGYRHAFLARASVMGSESTATRIATILSAAASRTATNGSPERRRWAATTEPASQANYALARQAFEWRHVVPWGGHPFWHDQTAPHSLRRLPYLFTVEDAASIAVLPVPDEQGCEGFPRARRTAGRRTALVEDAQADEPGVALGRLLHQGAEGPPALLPLTALNRHVLVVGAPGSGKTTTVHTLLYDLWVRHRIPWIAIEPVKTEYRSLIRAPGMEELGIFTLGQEDVAPLRLNPLMPSPGISREQHMSAVMASFSAALPLDPPLPALLEEALDRTYENAGWRYESTSEDGLAPPTLRDVIPAYEQVVKDHGYSREVRDNLTAAISARLKTMMRGARGRLLDSVESADWRAVMGRPVVIELDSIRNPEEKAVLAAFVIDRVRAAAKQRGSSGGQLKHVTVFEEAHQLLARVDPGSESARAAAIRSFCDDIAELRALGEGFVISDQRPSALADAAVANTGTRILHRLESAADRNIVLADLDVQGTDAESAARLARGEAVLRWPDREEAEFVKIAPAAEIDTGAPVTAADVAAWTAAQTETMLVLRPYRLCAAKQWGGGCDPVTRARGEEIARATKDHCERIWKGAKPKPTALGPIAARLIREAGGDPHQAYCAAVHLSVTSEALHVPHRDIGPRVARAIEDAAGRRR